MDRLKVFTFLFGVSCVVTLGVGMVTTQYLEMMNHYINIHSHQPDSQAFLTIKNADLLEVDSQYLYSVGLHPWSITSNYTLQMQLIKQTATHPQVLAIGETGLDKVCNTPLELQKEVFLQHIQLAQELQRPLIIHCVKAFDELLALKKETAASVPFIIHGFKGKIQQAQQLLTKDCYLSFGVKFSPETLLAMPLERMFLETDEADKSIEEHYREVAQLLDLPIEKLRAQILDNFNKVFHESFN